MSEFSPSSELWNQVYNIRRYFQKGSLIYDKDSGRAAAAVYYNCLENKPCTNLTGKKWLYNFYYASSFEFLGLLRYRISHTFSN